MIAGVWGRKVGMTQVFVNDTVNPVTVIDVGNWLITNIKTVDRDGYNAVQVGCIKKRYAGQQFSPEWLKDLKQYFRFVREIKVDSIEGLTVGQPLPVEGLFSQDSRVDVFGVTKGHGFAGVVRRHGYAGARASHGSAMGKRPGSMGGPRTQGKVYKGKELPGHMGVDKRVMKNLKVVQLSEAAPDLLLVKGSVPGKAGSLVYVRKVS